jgi:hypothetical protein
MQMQYLFRYKHKCKYKIVTAVHMFTDICYDTELHQNDYMGELLHYYLHACIIDTFSFM